MNDFVSLFAEVWSILWDLPITRFAFCLIPFFLFSLIIRMFCGAFIGRDSFSFPFDDIVDWLKDKIITWMCSSEEGFNIAYKLGWAREGVDFCTCGFCPECPKKDTCPYVVPDDVVEGCDVNE